MTLCLNCKNLVWNFQAKTHCHLSTPHRTAPSKISCSKHDSRKRCEGTAGQSDEEAIVVDEASGCTRASGKSRWISTVELAFLPEAIGLGLAFDVSPSGALLLVIVDNVRLASPVWRAVMSVS